LSYLDNYSNTKKKLYKMIDFMEKINKWNSP
jgi:hypothetical protein